MIILILIYSCCDFHATNRNTETSSECKTGVGQVARVLDKIVDTLTV